MNIFAAIGTTLDSVINVVVSTCRTVDKSIQLVEREVDELTADQQLRIETLRNERLKLIKDDSPKE